MKQASCPSQWLILHHGPDLVVWVSLFVYCLVEPDIHLFVYILFTYIIAVIHIWLVGGFKHFLFSIIYGMSSFPLTFIFFRGLKTTNQKFIHTAMERSLFFCRRQDRWRRNSPPWSTMVTHVTQGSAFHQEPRVKNEVLRNGSTGQLGYLMIIILA